jgi:hypothetical protein
MPSVPSGSFVTDRISCWVCKESSQQQKYERRGLWRIGRAVALSRCTNIVDTVAESIIAEVSGLEC